MKSEYSLFNPLSIIVQEIMKYEEQNYRVIGIMINPVTYYNYRNNSFIVGLIEHGDEFVGFPDIKRIFNNHMALNKIVIVTDRDQVSFPVGLN